jgi:hypothetical protein
VMMITWAAGLMLLGRFVFHAARETAVEAAATLLVLTIAVPFYFHHEAVAYAWAFLGLAPALYAYFTDDEVARGWMIGMLGLIAAHFGTLELSDPVMRTALFHVGPEAIDKWMLVGWGAAIYGLLLAWLGRVRSVRAADGSTVKRGAQWAAVAGSGIATLL